MRIFQLTDSCQQMVMQYSCIRANHRNIAASKMKRKSPVSFIILFFCIFISTAAMADARPVVFVSILPQKFFVQQIGGDLVDVEVMVPPGASPHTYEPKPSQMRRLAEARIYFTIGVALEDAWLDRFATINPAMKLVRTEAGIAKLAMAEHHHDDRKSNTDQPAHEEDGLDPHIWLSPALVKKQAETIKDSLMQLDPTNQELILDNYAKFIERIEDLDQRMNDILRGKKGFRFMVFHPSWGYFADSYGLVQVAVEIEGKSPKTTHLQELVQLARDEQISVVFAQPQFSRKSAEVIAREIGGEVVLIDPLAEDWLANMESVAEILQKALR